MVGSPCVAVTVKITDILTEGFVADARIITLAVYVPVFIPAAEAVTFTVPEFVPLDGVTLSQFAVAIAFHEDFPHSVHHRYRLLP